MAGNFTTEADVMLAAAGKVEATNGEVNAELARLRGVVDSVRGVWKGQAQTSFDNLMNRWNESARGLQEALDAIAGNIRSNAHHFDNVEAQNAQALGAVGGGAGGGLVL